MLEILRKYKQNQLSVMMLILKTLVECRCSFSDYESPRATKPDLWFNVVFRAKVSNQFIAYFPLPLINNNFALEYSNNNKTGLAVNGTMDTGCFLG